MFLFDERSASTASGQQRVPGASWSAAGAGAAGAASGGGAARGLRKSLSEGWMPSSYSVKLKSGGSGRPLGRCALGSRSSSKKLCAHACSGDRRAPGVYSSSRDTSEMASGGVHARNTCAQRCR